MQRCTGSISSEGYSEPQAHRNVLYCLESVRFLSMCMTLLDITYFLHRRYSGYCSKSLSDVCCVADTPRFEVDCTVAFICLVIFTMTDCFMLCLHICRRLSLFTPYCFTFPHFKHFFSHALSINQLDKLVSKSLDI